MIMVLTHGMLLQQEIYCHLSCTYFSHVGYRKQQIVRGTKLLWITGFYQNRGFVNL